MLESRGPGEWRMEGREEGDRLEEERESDSPDFILIMCVWFTLYMGPSARVDDPRWIPPAFGAPERGPAGPPGRIHGDHVRQGNDPPDAGGLRDDKVKAAATRIPLALVYFIIRGALPVSLDLDCAASSCGALPRLCGSTA